MRCHDAKALSKIYPPPTRDVCGSGREIPTPRQSRYRKSSFLRLMEEPVLPGCAWVLARVLIRSISNSEAFRIEALAAIRGRLRAVLATLLILSVTLSSMTLAASGGDAQVGHRSNRHTRNHQSVKVVTVRFVLPTAETCPRTRQNQTSVQANPVHSPLSLIETLRTVVLRCAFRPIRC